MFVNKSSHTLGMLVLPAAVQIFSSRGVVRIPHWENHIRFDIRYGRKRPCQDVLERFKRLNNGAIHTNIHLLHLFKIFLWRSLGARSTRQTDKMVSKGWSIQKHKYAVGNMFGKGVCNAGQGNPTSVEVLGCERIFEGIFKPIIQKYWAEHEYFLFCHSHWIVDLTPYFTCLIPGAWILYRHLFTIVMLSLDDHFAHLNFYFIFYPSALPFQMMTPFWLRPKHYIDDPLEPYHTRYGLDSPRVDYSKKFVRERPKILLDDLTADRFFDRLPASETKTELLLQSQQSDLPKQLRKAMPKARLPEE